MILFGKRFLLIIGCLLLLPMSAYAQNSAAAQTVDLLNGYSISLPLDWTVLRGSGGIYTARSTDLTLKIFTPAVIDSLTTDISANTNVTDALVTLYALPPTVVAIAKSDVEKTRYGERVAAVYTDTDASDSDQLAVVVAMPGGLPGYLLFSADKGELDSQQETITSIVTSFVQTGVPAADSASTGHGLGIGEAASSDSSASDGTSTVNCTVSAESADAAQLRVGPGTNRGAISFLPVNIDVAVTGRIVLNDKSVWYQLDKNEAAPKGTAAAELWVAATSVTATGDCDHVGETSAPPVIPGSIAPPPANNSSASGDAGSANTAPGALPTAGTWIMTINATTNASCQGYENVPIPSTEVFDSLTFTFSMYIINSSSFNYGDDVFTRISGTNSFSGSFTFDDGTNAQIRFDLTSPTSMFGQAVTNFTDSGTPCSATALFLTNHR